MERLMTPRANFPLRGQFDLRSLFVLIAIVGVLAGVVASPVPAYEKVVPFMTVCLCVEFWWRRNYLHPRQASIGPRARRAFALRGAFSSVTWLVLLAWLFLSRWRSDHPIYFTDIVFWSASAALLVLTMMQVYRAMSSDDLWEDTVGEKSSPRNANECVGRNK
jgi:hypothetical protein